MGVIFGMCYNYLMQGAAYEQYSTGQKQNKW